MDKKYLFINFILTFIAAFLAISLFVFLYHTKRLMTPPTGQVVPTQVQTEQPQAGQTQVDPQYPAASVQPGMQYPPQPGAQVQPPTVNQVAPGVTSSVPVPAQPAAQRKY